MAVMATYHRCSRNAPATLSVLTAGGRPFYEHKTMTYRIAENFQGRKLSRISRFCGYLRKFSLRNLGAWHPLTPYKRVICKSFLRENRIFHQFAKVFFLKSFPLYDIPVVTDRNQKLPPLCISSKSPC